MRIREVMLAGVRGYPELRRVSFVDSLTDRVRQLTVIAGSNGTGKTTFLEAIYELMLRGLAGSTVHCPLLQEVEASSSGAGLVFESARNGRPLSLHVGRHDQPVDDVLGPSLDLFFRAVHSALGDGSRAREGIIYFTHNRWVTHPNAGSIEPPSAIPSWIWRFEAADAWVGSLSQLWVWQNYLDLEEGREGRPNLAKFVELVETVLGGGRTVRIHKGRVTIEGGGRPAVEPHQLPSSEQQILTLFGELGRRLRPGAVVMIDEVEISLHPALQRKVIAILRDLAEKYDLQIIVTTHSTEILRAVDPSEVVSLDDLES